MLVTRAPSIVRVFCFFLFYLFIFFAEIESDAANEMVGKDADTHYAPQVRKMAEEIEEDEERLRKEMDEGDYDEEDDAGSEIVDYGFYFHL